MFKTSNFISSYTEVNGASLVTFLKSSFTSQTIKLLLLYKKHAIPLTDFCNWLQGFIGSNTVDITLGDFNINAVQEYGRLGVLLSSYKQISGVATREGDRGSRPSQFNFRTKQGPTVSITNITDIAFYRCSEIIRTRNLPF